MKTFRLKHAYDSIPYDGPTVSKYRVIDGETGKPITSALPYWLAMKHMWDFERGQKIVDQLIPMEAASRDTRGVLASVWATGSYIVGALALIGAIAWATPANSQNETEIKVRNCYVYEEVAEKLEADYGETLAFTAATATGYHMEIFVSPVGTFTVLMTPPGGSACVVEIGDNWEDVRQAGEDGA